MDNIKYIKINEEQIKQINKKQEIDKNKKIKNTIMKFLIIFNILTIFILFNYLTPLNKLNVLEHKTYARSSEVTSDTASNQYLEIEGKGAQNEESGKMWKAELKEDIKKEENNSETKTSLKQTKRKYILLPFVLILGILTYIYLKMTKENNKDIFAVQKDEESMF